MSTLTRIIVSSIISLFMLSCNFSMNFGPGIDGSKNVVSADRNISTDFNAVKVSQGLNLYITQSKNVSLSIEADDNLHDIIVTKVENGTLSIYTTENIRRASSKNILLSVPNLNTIKATSGSNVYATSAIDLNKLELTTTSGANIKLDIKTQNLICRSTSGSNIILNGTTKNMTAEATSGSNIRASNLSAETSNVKATSGANVTINTLKELTARATSGGNVRYSGNPESINKSDSSAGSIRAQ
ncbi:head GIN domain-containing protein [Winogradskyella sp. PE311]|uniref:head GIN domain-containing protein n=1 Tax=Winogradskyella sp. PE311 TaxID=3366943 RepID=UPI00397FB720